MPDASPGRSATDAPLAGGRSAADAPLAGAVPGAVEPAGVERDNHQTVSLAQGTSNEPAASMPVMLMGHRITSQDRRTSTVQLPLQRGLQQGPVVGLRVLPHGRRFAFDSFCIEGFPKRILVIGAAPGCDMVIDDATVSGLHCLLERHGERVLVHDCQSKNGTRVNGVRVQEGELTPGTLLTLGRISLVACGPDAHWRRVTLAAASHDEFLRTAVAAHGSLRAAAEALGLPYSTLRGWLKNKKGNGSNGAGPR